MDFTLNPNGFCFETHWLSLTIKRISFSKKSNLSDKSTHTIPKARLLCQGKLVMC